MEATGVSRDFSHKPCCPDLEPGCSYDPNPGQAEPGFRDYLRVALPSAVLLWTERLGWSCCLGCPSTTNVLHVGIKGDACFVMRGDVDAAVLLQACFGFGFCLRQPSDMLFFLSCGRMFSALLLRERSVQDVLALV